MAARNGGTRPSELAGILCENAALDFDLACVIRLNQHDIERDEAMAKRIAYETCKMAFGDGESDEQSDGAEVW